ncbi:MAG TPA: hypothetical protein O0X66_00225, partial [Methanocorpusculum sp.]|nr:hypothetical protein [Methanocorpusculum sp.]
MTNNLKLSLQKNRSEERGIFTRTAVLLLVLTLLFAGGICGFAAADDLVENTTDTGAVAKLSNLAAALNSTATNLTTKTTADVSADLEAIAADIETAQLALSETPLASFEVQDLIRIKNNISTASSDQLYEDVDKAGVVSTIKTAQTDLALVNDSLNSTLSWARNDSESYASDTLILEQACTDIINISASLETAAASLTAETPDISAIRDHLITQIGELIVIRDELVADAAPLIITDELTGIIGDLQASADSLQNGSDPALVSLDIISSSAAVEALTLQIADQPVTETGVPTETPTEIPTETPTEIETTTVPTAVVTIPVETQTPQEDNGAGIIILVIVVIVCIGAVGAGSVIFKKRRDHHGFDTFPAPRRAQEQQPVESDRQKQIERPAPAPTPEPILPAEPKKPIMIPSDAGPAELFELVAETIAKNRGIGNSKALAPRELIDPTNPDPQLIEYIALYEKVRYSRSPAPGETARLKELAARILKENA